MSGVETNPVIPAFEPRFQNVHGFGMFYLDNRMDGAVDVSIVDGQQHLLISEWSAQFRIWATAVRRWNGFARSLRS